MLNEIAIELDYGPGAFFCESVLIGEIDWTYYGRVPQDDPRGFKNSGMLSQVNHEGGIARIRRDVYDRLPYELREIIRRADSEGVIPHPILGSVPFKGRVVFFD